MLNQYSISTQSVLGQHSINTRSTLAQQTISVRPAGRFAATIAPPAESEASAPNAPNHLKNKLRKLIQAVLPDRPIMTALFFNPDMRHRMLREIGMRPVADILEAVPLAAG